MDSSFPIILASNNASFPNNKSCKFRTLLPKTLKFDGTWYCGVQNVMYTHSWNTYEIGENVFYIHLSNGDKVSVEIPKVDFFHIKDFENAINDSIKNSFDFYLVDKFRKRREILRDNEIVEDELRENEIAYEDFNQLALNQEEPLKENTKILENFNEELNENIEMHLDTEDVYEIIEKIRLPVIKPKESVSITESDLQFENVGHFPDAKELNVTQSVTNKGIYPKKININEGEILPTDKIVESSNKEIKEIEISEAFEALAEIQDDAIKDMLIDARIIKDHKENYLIFSKNHVPFSVQIVNFEEESITRPGNLIDKSKITKITPFKEVGIEEAKFNKEANPEFIRNLSDAKFFRYVDGNVFVVPKDGQKFSPYIISQDGNVYKTNIERFWDIFNNSILIEVDEEDEDEEEDLFTESNVMTNANDTIMSRVYTADKDKPETILGTLPEIIADSQDLLEDESKIQMYEISETIKLPIAKTSNKVDASEIFESSIDKGVEKNVKFIPPYDITTTNVINYQNTLQKDIILDQIEGENIGKRKLRTEETRDAKRQKTDSVNQVTYKYFEEARNSIRFLFQYESSRFVFKAPKNLVLKIELSAKLHYMLGYEINQNIVTQSMAKYIPDIRAGIHKFCLYENSGLTEPMIFGDKMTSILRVVNVTSEPGKNEERDYNYIVWKRVLAKEITDIEIEIKDMQGNFVQFNYGEVIITLIFRRDF